MPTCLALLLLGLLSLSAPIQASVPPFKQDDRVAFIGDSITHGGRYHADIYLYHATRFPDHLFVAYNCGIAGDTARELISASKLTLLSTVQLLPPLCLA